MQEIEEPRAGDDLYKGIKVIDADTHISEPYDLWTSRAPAKYRERVPQMRETDGKWVWTIEGDISMGLSSAASVIHKDRTKAEGLEFTDWRIPDVHPSCSQVRERLEFMDQTGIWAQIVYPNVLGFGGQGYSAAGGGGAASRSRIDPELRLISTQIYNDAMAEMQSESGGRLLPMALLPWWDIDLAVKEAERCGTMGMKGDQYQLGSPVARHGGPDWRFLGTALGILQRDRYASELPYRRER